jgi:type I restriction enzyme, S subunit
MLMGWKQCQLGDVLTLQRGFDITKKEQKQGSVPVISSSGINSFHNTAKVDGPGVIIGRKGSLGTVFYIEEDYWPHDTTLWVKDFHGNFPKFAYYFLSTLNLAQFDAGASNPTLNRNHVHLLPVYWPPLPIQRKIAAILSAYDDLIENNTRRIAILEEMAQSLYREWFVHFRFPGHEKKRLVESELGLIPEGWEVVKLGEICFITMGQSPSSQFYNESGDGLPFHQGVSDFGNLFPVDRMYCTVANRIAEAGDILFSVRAPVGRINVANKKIVIGRGLSAMLSKTGNQGFVFQQLKEIFQEEDTIGNGAIFKSVTKEDMHGIKMLKPPQTIVSSLEQHVKPVFSNIEILTTKNTNLRQTRDLLLPKLISGEVEVEGLDIDTEAIQV